MSQYEDLKLDVLLAIYRDAFRPGSLSQFGIDDLDRVLPAEMVCGITRSIVYNLHNDKYLDCDFGYYSISSEGIRHIEFIYGELDTAGDEIDHSVTRSLSGQFMVPASDLMVALNHNSDPYREALRALDSAVSAFRNDHCLEDEWGPEKGILLQSIEAGQRLLKEGQVRAATIYTTIVSPLRIVADRYKEAVAAELVTAGVDQVIPLFEGRFIRFWR
jgi:hypothetical protein